MSKYVATYLIILCPLMGFDLEITIFLIEFWNWIQDRWDGNSMENPSDERRLINPLLNSYGPTFREVCISRSLSNVVFLLPLRNPLHSFKSPPFITSTIEILLAFFLTAYFCYRKWKVYIALFYSLFFFSIYCSTTTLWIILVGGVWFLPRRTLLHFTQIGSDKFADDTHSGHK